MDNYIEQAMRTCAPGDNLLHCALGLVTETAEIFSAPDADNLREEMGDLMWYVAVGCDHFGVTLQEAIEAAPQDEPRDGLEVVGDFVNNMKRLMFYKKALPTDHMVVLLGEVITGVQADCGELGFDFNEILSDNIAKLRKRYPDKFTEYLAVNR